MRHEFYKTLSSPILWIVLAVTAMLPFVLSSYYMNIVTLALVYVALASAWNIVGGMAGQISLAHSLFIGVGAMFSTALLLRYGINMWLGLVISAAISLSRGTRCSFCCSRCTACSMSFWLLREPRLIQSPSRSSSIIAPRMRWLAKVSNCTPCEGS